MPTCGECAGAASDACRPQLGETDERLSAMGSWREAPYFTDAERAALALTEAATRLSDRAHSVPDEIWDEAARHDDEPALAALVITIATMVVVWSVGSPRRATGPARGHCRDKSHHHRH